MPREGAALCTLCANRNSVSGLWAMYVVSLKSPPILPHLRIETPANYDASDFADEFETIQVIGTDISPIQPTWIPPNLKL